MTWGYVAVGAATLIGSAMSSNASKSAASRQADAAKKAANLQQDQFAQTNENQRPYREAGYSALNSIQDQLGGDKYFSHQFNQNDLKNGLSPNYDFQLQQGQDAQKNMANATGGLVGGNALQGLEKYTQDYAGGAYQNSFNNYQNQRSNIYNTLASIAGLGQQGVQNTGNAGMNAANNAGNYLTSGAAAQAAGTVGSANAINSGLSNLAGYQMWSGMNNNGSAAKTNNLAQQTQGELNHMPATDWNK